MIGSRLVRELFEIRDDIPVILMTGMSEQVTPERFADLGISEMIMKPLTAQDMALAIRRVLNDEK